jgi:hypothetical protein
LRQNETSADQRRRELAIFNLAVERYAPAPTFLDSHSLVRRTELPAIVVQASLPAIPRVKPTDVTIPIRDSRRTHPHVSAIDGGIADPATMGQPTFPLAARCTGP